MWIRESAIWIIFVFLCLIIATPAAPNRKGNCLKPRLENGKTKFRGNNRIVKYSCLRGYFLVGSDYATCTMGEWSSPTPVCATTGCHKLNAPDNGRIMPQYSGSVILTECNPGYRLTKDATVFCDGMDWNGTIPSCEANAGEEAPAKLCDFERDDLCAWTQDPSHDFDWRRQNLATSSSHVGTGPSYDHTLGPGRDGYYLYIEASSPRRENDTARLFSPVYGPVDSVDACFTFWYHMYGATTGQLRVYVKPESLKFSALKPVFQQMGEKGNRWFQGVIPISPLAENFQIVIEGVRGSSYVSDTAIDDVAIQHGDQCNPTQPTTPGPDATKPSIKNPTLVANESCQSRCGISFTVDVLASSERAEPCSCHASCFMEVNCCADYLEFCQERNTSSSTSASSSAAGYSSAESTTLSSSSRNLELVPTTTTSESSELTGGSSSWPTSSTLSPSWSSTSTAIFPTSLSSLMTSGSDTSTVSVLTSLTSASLPISPSAGTTTSLSRNTSGSAISQSESSRTRHLRGSPEAYLVVATSPASTSNTSHVPANTTGSSISWPESPQTSVSSSTTVSLPHLSSSTVYSSSNVPDRLITASSSSTWGARTTRLSTTTQMTAPAGPTRPTPTKLIWLSTSTAGSDLRTVPRLPLGQLTSRYPPTSKATTAATTRASHATTLSRNPETDKVFSPNLNSGTTAGRTSQELLQKDLNDDPAERFPSSADQDSNTGLMAGVFGGGAAILFLIIVGLGLVLRRSRSERSSASQQHRLPEDSDVRFLHAEDDVQLDLREAKPQFENFEEL